MDARYDAIVVGAGPAGAAAAILLARAGWSVAVLEKQAFPRRKVCGECIAATNLPLLDALGLGDAFASMAGPPLRRVAVMAGPHTVEADLPPMRDARHRWGRALGRELLDALLLDRARDAGATVLQPWTVRAASGGPGGYVCEAAETGSDAMLRIGAPVLIAACGSWQPSPVQCAEQGGGHGERRAPRPGDLFAFKANFTGAALHGGLLPVLALPGGYGGMVVGEQGMATLACCIRRDRLAAIRHAMPGLPAGEAVEAWLGERTAGVSHALAGARRRGTWLAAGPIRPGIRMPAPAAAETGPLLVGNAAGEAHPIIGEGISMAMQSSFLLCSLLLAEGRRPDAHSQQRIAGEYARRWQGHFASRIRLAAAFAHLAMQPSLVPALLPLLSTMPALLTRAAILSGKVRTAPALATTNRLRQPESRSAGRQ